MSDTSLIIYDGECVFCQNYVRFVRLREAVGPVELIDARSGDPRIAQYWRSYDLNEGMLFVHRGKVHHGADAVHVLAGLTSSIGAFNKVNARIFANGGVTGLLYPLLKAGRRLTLAARGRGLLKRPGDNPTAEIGETRDRKSVTE